VNGPVGEIPVALRATEDDPPAAPAPAAERPRVLLVDDDERNLLAIATVLEDLGEVVLARSGEEALRHLLKGEFAVILLDVYMPGMDGYETAKIIRDREQSKGIPIVFLSAVNKEAEHLMRGYSMGAVDYVFKPVDPIVLRSKVAVFVDLFAKTKEIELKALQQQALLDANLKANAERLRVERELRFAEQRQAAIIQALPIVLYVEDLDEALRVPQYVAGNFEALTGFAREQVAAEPDVFFDHLHPEDHERVRRALEQRLVSGTMSIEYRWRHADGKYRHFLDQTVELPDEGSGQRRVAGTFLDVTDRRELESQLVQAQKMDAIGKLTGGIAHDFNNLLAAVIGGLSVIERRIELKPDQQRVLDMTKRAAEQGSELVRRLLAFARRQRLEPHAIGVLPLRDAVFDLLSHTLGGLVKLEWQVDEGVWDVFADQSQLELALVNLIINARDAMPDGGTVRLLAENRKVSDGELSGIAAGDYVRLAVEDNGTGIAPDDLEKVLEPFFTTKDVGKGSGLGLSMVYGFAKQSDGAFRIASELGDGTTAELWLPRAPESAAEARTSTVEKPRATTRPLTVLLVDDHPEVRSTTAALLSDCGHRVVEAENGSEALGLLRNRECDFDLLITDYAMPHLSGTDFLREARDLGSETPALLITGYADAGMIRDRPPGVETLLKPFTPMQLECAIAKAATSGRRDQPSN
jgi:PAS domain S-box-containing protein